MDMAANKYFIIEIMQCQLTFRFQLNVLVLVDVPYYHVHYNVNL